MLNNLCTDTFLLHIPTQIKAVKHRAMFGTQYNSSRQNTVMERRMRCHWPVNKQQGEQSRIFSVE